MATPAIRALRRRFPDAHLTVMVGRSCRAALEGNPHVTESFVIDDRILYGASQSARAALALGTLRRLRRRHFDCAFVCHRDWRFNLLVRLAGIPERYGFDRNGEGLFLTSRFRPSDGDHHIDQYLSVVGLAGVAPDGRQMDFNVGPRADEAADRMFEALGISSGAAVVGVCPGGARNVREVMETRRWPVEHFRQLIHGLTDRGTTQVMVFGGPTDVDLHEHLRLERPGIHNVIGKTTLEETGALMRRCRVVVANDSGPMHLASAVGTPVIALFGPTDPREKFPLNEGSIYFWKPDGLACCPCYRDGRFPPCLIDVECLRRIRVHEVVESVERRLRPASAEEGSVNHRSPSPPGRVEESDRGR